MKKYLILQIKNVEITIRCFDCWLIVRSKHYLCQPKKYAEYALSYRNVIIEATLGNPLVDIYLPHNTQVG